MRKNNLTLERRLFATPGAPGAGQGGHFRLSTWILRDTEVIATNDFFQKQGAPFSDRYNYSKQKLHERSTHSKNKSKAQIFELLRSISSKI